MSIFFIERKKVLLYPYGYCRTSFAFKIERGPVENSAGSFCAFRPGFESVGFWSHGGKNNPLRPTKKGPVNGDNCGLRTLESQDKGQIWQKSRFFTLRYRYLLELVD